MYRETRSLASQSRVDVRWVDGYWKWNSWFIVLPGAAKIFESGIAKAMLDWIRIMPNEGKLPVQSSIRKRVQLKRIEHPNDWAVFLQGKEQPDKRSLRPVKQAGWQTRVSRQK